MRQINLQPRLIEQVYRALLDAICEGRLSPGERLTQESVAEKLNVSRQPVGQALTLLKSQGFLRISGRRGLMVAPLDPEFVRCLYEFRAALEETAAGAAAGRVDRAARARARRILKAGHKALDAGSIPRLIAADMDFHRTVYDLSGNAIIAEIMNLYWNHLRRVMSSILNIDGYPANVWKEHEAIFEAIVAGDGESARARARAHVEDASRVLQQVLARQAGNAPPPAGRARMP
jgi:DNA-binding GntR family transcriptional regulator